MNAAPSGDFYSVLNVSLARIAAYTSGCIAEKLLFTTFRNPEIYSEIDLVGCLRAESRSERSVRVVGPGMTFEATVQRPIRNTSRRE